MGECMDGQLILVTSVIVVALVFDFLNGFHDAANSIATVVSTKVLSPRAAVLLAAVCNFAAAFLLETKVAATIGHDIVHSQYLDPYMVMFGLLGAIIWDLITWWFGLPTSSSHALVGGFAGAAVAKAGWMALKPQGLHQGRPLHRHCSPCRTGAGPIDDDAGILHFQEFNAAQSGSLFPQGPARLSFHIQLQPRHERRPEDHGHYSGPP